MDNLLQAVPLLRIYDEDRAREFYLDYLGFTLDWEHRFEEALPLYAQVSRDGVRLHLTGHHGDATPGSTVLVQVADARALLDELRAQDYDMLRPGLEHQPWGLEVSVVDPFGNTLRFHEPQPADAAEVPEPIRHEVVVAVEPSEAFDRFTGRYGEWWDKQYTPDPGTYDGMSVVPRVGGTVALRHRDAEEHPIGEVTVWEPGERFTQTFTLALPPGLATTLDVRFTADPAGSRVALEHGGWTAGTAHLRDSFGDWAHLLDRYAALT
ncbi:glyoxalase superfamily protein [uncultured Nocardioides sp.]|uniref:Bleomycin resistance protein n=1 Tax=uncultured Nocardioides sp. TaxID=198441 RepID=A0A6J4N9H9_9ACTN|nr:glyoxalase superfamily protein [uncultured Nocardioides sp.]CAA9377836.1 MAG: Glyoxalase family protein [uncultured Nocardioides sp.]